MMLSFKIAKWYNNANSPVMFMIDDFCNKWVDLNGNGEIDLEEDWGYAMNGPNSSFSFLKTSLLEKYPSLKVTFFTPVGKRTSIIKETQIGGHSGPINENEEIKEFFRSVHRDKRFEIVYHGLTHGIPGNCTDEFSQEWEVFGSVKEAVKQIEKGKEIYLDTFGEYPKGGKYCGYKYNNFGDESINETGFLWWCRDWNRGQSDITDEIRFEPKYFGVNKVIDIPSTIDGCSFAIYKDQKPLKSIAKKILKSLWIKRGQKKFTALLKARQIISIQEHIAPAREDMIRQVPNIFDDKESLCIIFDFLKNKNVWHATGTEIAEYFEARENTKIGVLINDNLEIQYSGRIEKPWLTLLVERHDAIELTSPSGKTYASQKNRNDNEKYNLINIEIENGYYRVKKQQG